MLGTAKVIVQIYDNGSPQLQIASASVKITSGNQVVVDFAGVSTSGEVVVLGFHAVNMNKWSKQRWFSVIFYHLSDISLMAFGDHRPLSSTVASCLRPQTSDLGISATCPERQAGTPPSTAPRPSTEAVCYFASSGGITLQTNGTNSNPADDTQPAIWWKSQ